jgi:hypothetical protein
MASGLYFEYLMIRDCDVSGIAGSGSGDFRVAIWVAGSRLLANTDVPDAILSEGFLHAASQGQGGQTGRIRLNKLGPY